MVNNQLTENEVINFISIHLKKNGYTDIKTKNTKEKGIDVIAFHSQKVNVS
jgi:hypothetical protein